LRRAKDIVVMIATVVGGAAIVVFLVIFDLQLLLDVYERSESALPIVAGAVAAVGTVVGVVWYRKRADGLDARVRRRFGRAAIAWSVLFIVAFAATHYRSREPEDAGPLQAAVVTYVLLIIVAAVAFAPIALLRQSWSREHRQDDRIEVWRVDEKEPYYVSYCECGWVGPVYDADEPDARDKAFRDARGHGTNVAPEVAYPYG
jgi:uncharacterized membrane protein YozB (DUF420 family)